MATQARPGLWFPVTGGTLETKEYPEAASQTFKRGDILYLASGKLTIAQATPGSNIAAGTKLIGVANRDASGTTDTMIPITVINGAFRMVLPVTHATPASAVTAITQVGTSFELEYTSAAVGFSVAIDDTSNTKVQVVGLHPGPGTANPFAAGEQYGWVEVKVLDAQTAVNV